MKAFVTLFALTAYAQVTDDSRRDPHCIVPLVGAAPCHSVDIPWSGYAHDPQHTAVSANQAQNLHSIHWQTPVDLNPPGGGQGDLLIHYGSPIVTAGNTIIVPVKTGATDGFQLQAFNGATGAPIYTLPTDYSLPAHDWIPPYAPTLSLGSRLY